MFKKAGKMMALAVFFFSVFLTKVVLASGSAVEDAENGIVRVVSGFIDGKGEFQELKSGCGFLISNMESSAVMITNQSVVSCSAGEIKNFCKKHDMNRENIQETGCIRIIVKGDVTVEASVLTESKEQDYCILSVANALSEKSALKLGDASKQKKGDKVFALGFADEPGQIAYSKEDVELRTGTLNAAGVDQEGKYLSHSIPITKGLEGSPLLDADGYVIGLNCTEAADSSDRSGYALSIHEIVDVLDNFSLYYGSDTMDESYIQLKKFYEKCQIILSKGGFKADSMEPFREALEAAGETLEQEYPQEEALVSAFRTLKEAKEALIPKMETIVKIILVLAVCIIGAFLWLVALIILNAKEKKLERRLQASGNIGQDTAGQKVRKQSRKLILVNDKTGEDIEVSKDSFVIGSGREMADYCVTGNRAVSRKHAVIKKEKDSFQITDLGSLNGTCVNGVKIAPGNAVELKGGDEIVMAGEAFSVKEC